MKLPPRAIDRPAGISCAAPAAPGSAAPNPPATRHERSIAHPARPYPGTGPKI